MGIATLNRAVCADPAVDVSGFALNPERGDSRTYVKYGRKAVEHLLAKNKLHGVIRGSLTHAGAREAGCPIATMDGQLTCNVQRIYSTAQFPQLEGIPYICQRTTGQVLQLFMEETILMRAWTCYRNSLLLNLQHDRRN